MPGVSLDSSVVLCWMLQEQGWHAVDKLIEQQAVELVLPGPVLTEVIGLAAVKGNVSPARQIHATLAAVRIATRPAVEDDLVRAGELLRMSRQNQEPRKGRLYDLSLGDSLALAVTERLALPVLTKDRHWSWLAAKGLLPGIVVHQL